MTTYSRESLDGEMTLFPIDRVRHTVRHPDIVVSITDQLADLGRMDEAEALLYTSESLINNIDKYTEEFPLPA